jgi:hypothetical protein
MHHVIVPAVTNANVMTTARSTMNAKVKAKKREIIPIAIVLITDAKFVNTILIVKEKKYANTVKMDFVLIMKELKNEVDM